WAVGLAGSPIILHMHFDPALTQLPGRSSSSHFLLCQLIRPANVLFTLTEAYRERFCACSVSQPVYVVPNMCDETSLAFPAERQRELGMVRIAVLGRLSREKGILDVLQVAAQLRREHPHIHFDVAGLPSTEQEERLVQETMQREHLRDTVTLLGLVTGQAKVDLFERADILLSASYRESFGIVATEAMAAALPVIGTRVAGLRSIVVENETGYLVEPGDVSTMKQCLIALAQ
ncbi:unnamed protein product, partial [marine sediment metagenome]